MIAPRASEPSGSAAPGSARLIANLVGFQAGWFACVLGAAAGMPWLGPLVAAPILLWHLRTAARPAAEAGFLALAAILGFALDSALVQAGRLRFEVGLFGADLAPYWMVTLWVLFASTMNVSLRWLKTRLLVAAALGAVGGPLAYWAGARLGAAQLLEPLWLSLGAVGLGYATATPLLILAARRLDGFAPEPEGRA